MTALCQQCEVQPVPADRRKFCSEACSRKSDQQKFCDREKANGWPARKRWLAANPESKLLTYTKTSAFQKGLEHNITVEDIPIPPFCPVLRIPLFFTPGKRTPNTPTVDRLDNTKGYIKGNVRVVSWRANDLKKDASAQELYALSQFYGGLPMSFQKRSVYLAGPISGLTYQEARYTWRDEFAKLLHVSAPHVECFSPMRQKEFLENAQCLSGNGQALEEYGQAFAKPLGILTRDFNDVKERDMMVACFLGAQRVSIGTCWEVGVAYSHRKPLVVVMEKSGNIHDHVFITHTAGYRVETLEEAAMIAASILTPGV